jgi:hypothetical protein
VSSWQGWTHQQGRLDRRVRPPRKLPLMESCSLVHRSEHGDQLQRGWADAGGVPGVQLQPGEAPSTSKKRCGGNHPFRTSVQRGTLGAVGSKLSHWLERNRGSYSLRMVNLTVACLAPSVASDGDMPLRDWALEPLRGKIST